MGKQCGAVEMEEMEEEEEVAGGWAGMRWQALACASGGGGGACAQRRHRPALQCSSAHWATTVSRRLHAPCSVDFGA